MDATGNERQPTIATISERKETGLSMSELRPWIGKPPHVVAPDIPGYHQVSHERLEVGRLTLVGLVLIPVWAIFFSGLVAALGGRSSFSFSFTWTGPLLLLLVMVAVILLHEAVHGLTAAILGAKPAFGIGPGFAYTTFLEPMSKPAYLAVGAAPLLLLSALSIAGALAFPDAAGWLIFSAVLNASGAVGDLWMIWRIARSPKHARFYDLADGFAVFAPDASG